MLTIKFFCLGLKLVDNIAMGKTKSQSAACSSPCTRARPLLRRPRAVALLRLHLTKQNSPSLLSATSLPQWAVACRGRPKGGGGDVDRIGEHETSTGSSLRSTSPSNQLPLAPLVPADCWTKRPRPSHHHEYRGNGPLRNTETPSFLFRPKAKALWGKYK